MVLVSILDYRISRWIWVSNYRSFKLLDGHQKQVFSRETVALEFPGNRWLNVRTKGIAKDGALKSGSQFVI